MSNIILVDDDKEFIKSFANEAYAKGITVVSKHSFEGLKQLLPSNVHKYAAIVLDIKCLLTDDQAKEDPAFIGTALKYLDSTTPGFPRFILTGDESEFDSLRKYHREEKMFIKKPSDQQKLLAELENCVQNAEPLRIRRENSTVFMAFDKGLLPAKKEQTVLDLFKTYNETDTNKFKGIIGDIREVHEEIYRSINSRNKSVVPDKYISGNGSLTSISDFYRHITGNPDSSNKYAPTTKVYQDSTINGLTRFIQNACSEFLHGSSKTGYPISPYTIKSLINGLMELIIWSKQY